MKKANEDYRPSTSVRDDEMIVDTSEKLYIDPKCPILIKNKPCENECSLNFPNSCGIHKSCCQHSCGTVCMNVDEYVKEQKLLEKNENENSPNQQNRK